MPQCLECGRELKLTAKFGQDGKSTSTPVQIQDASEEYDKPVNEPHLCNECRMERMKKMYL